MRANYAYIAHEFKIAQARDYDEIVFYQKIGGYIPMIEKAKSIF